MRERIGIPAVEVDFHPVPREASLPVNTYLEVATRRQVAHFLL
jgi:hypothetical protein